MTYYLDANVLLYPLLFGDARAENCRIVLERMCAGELRILTSVLTWDEVVYIVRRHQGTEKAVQAGERLLRLPGLDFRSADLEVIRRAQELLGSTSLRPRDAIHAATALLYGAPSVITEDAAFGVVEGLTRIAPADLR